MVSLTDGGARRDASDVTVTAGTLTVEVFKLVRLGHVSIRRSSPLPGVVGVGGHTNYREVGCVGINRDDA